MRVILTLFIFISVIFFPWPLTAVVTIISSLYLPFLPFAIGIFADTLYYTPQTSFIPFLTIFGAIMTCAAILVRSRLKTSIIRG